MARRKLSVTLGRFLSMNRTNPELATRGGMSNATRKLRDMQLRTQQAITRNMSHELDMLRSSAATPAVIARHKAAMAQHARMAANLQRKLDKR